MQIPFFSFPEKVSYSFADFCGKKKITVVLSHQNGFTGSETVRGSEERVKNSRIFRKKPAPEAPVRGM